MMPAEHQEEIQPEDPTVAANRTHDRWTALCSVSDLGEEGGRYVALKGQGFAVFRLACGTVRVLDDACPHAGASLSGGHVSGDCVNCPWHGWPFELHKGHCPDNPAVRVKSYAVRVISNWVWIHLD